MKLKPRFLLLMAAIFCGFMSLIWFFSTELIKEINEKWAGQFTERQVIFDKYRTLSPLIREITLARKMAEDPDIMQMAMHEGDLAIRQRAIAAMENYRIDFRDHSYFVALAGSGNYYFNDAGNQYAGKQLRYVLSPKNENDKWFYATLAEGKDYQVNLDPDVHLGVAKVWINVLIRRRGEILGVLGTGIDLTDFLKETVSISQQGVHNLFIDKNMAIQLYNDPEMIDYMSIAKNANQRIKVDRLLKNADDISRLQQVMQHLEKTPDQHVTMEVDFNGSKHVLGVAYLPEVGWFDLTLMDTSGLILIKNQLLVPLILGSALLLALIAMGIALSRWVLKPITALQLSTERIQHGDFEFDTPFQGSGEIESLTRSFSDMAKYVREINLNLEDKVRQRTDDLHRITEREQFRNRILELLTGEQPLVDVLRAVVLGVEKLEPEIICSILLLTEDGKHLGKGVAPSLPDFYNAALDGIEIGMGVGSCGTAAFTGKQVLVEDIATHPYWAPYKDLAAKAGLGSCWSQPIISAAGKVLGTFAIYHHKAHTPTESDISLIENAAHLISLSIERKQAEASILMLNTQLERRVHERTEQLQFANNAKDSFLATMSHEIRTPLSGMLGMIELLRLSQLSPTQQQQLEIAQTSGKSLLRIVNDILDWSKIEAGKLELASHESSIAEMLNGVVSTYAQLASDKGIILKVAVDPQLSPLHIFDPLRLSQILNNFTSNAVKFTQQGSVEIGVQRLGARDGYETVRFSVKDSGHGIDPEQQSRLFQRYEQATAEIARMYGGTGLGLSICRRLAEMMDGTLSVESTLGVGSTFYFTISLHVADVTSSAEIAASSRTEAAVTVQRDAGAETALPLDCRSLAVLIVDDHPVNRILLKQQLGILGVQVEAAESGTPALKLWQSGHFDIIITDCHMPEMDGYELSRKIRNIEAQAGTSIHIPIIAWTANVLSDEVERCQLAGMDDMLTKPTELADLRAMLLKWMNRK